MWLTYGIDDHGSLVAVEDAPRGKTQLHCPYCRGGLTAKKGQVVQHHVAHTGETCRAVDRDAAAIGLPLYNHFNLHLTGKELDLLRRLWDEYGAGEVFSRPEQYTFFSRLRIAGMVAWNQYRNQGLGGYEMTKIGKIPVGALSLLLFNQVQEPLLHERYADLEQAVVEARTRTEAVLDQALTDLKLYRAQWRRILSTTLYFLEVHAAGETLYKIGVTQRSVDDRVAEIAQEVRAVAGGVTIRVLGTWPQRGNVELYFKHRYAAHQQRLGTLTEYFSFDDVGPVLRDLRRMPPKELSALERAVLADEPSSIELELAAEAEARAVALAAETEARALEQHARARSAAIAAGMEQARQQGIHVGRPAGGEAVDAFLAKATSQRVMEVLQAQPDLSIRRVARAAGVAVETVRKVSNAIGHTFRASRRIHERAP